MYLLFILINYSYYLQGEKGFPGAPGYTGSQVTLFTLQIIQDSETEIILEVFCLLWEYMY